MDSFNSSVDVLLIISTNASNDLLLPIQNKFFNFPLFDWAQKNQGALVVLMDMALAILSVVFNLIVITSVKEKEDTLGMTFNLVLINLCSSNLLSAVIVKSISIVHNAYAVAVNSTESDIAFCIPYTFGYRLTWSVLPWSVVVLSMLSVFPRLRRLQVCRLIISLNSVFSCSYTTG